MKDMKRPKPKKKDEDIITSSHEPYPYGLRIDLQEEELKKLGLKATDFKISSNGMLAAEFEVTSISINESANADRKNESVTLQIQKLEIKGKKPSKFSNYKDMSDSIGGVTGE